MRRYPFGNLNSNNPIKHLLKVSCKRCPTIPKERNRLLACKNFAFTHANVHKHCRHFRRG